MPRSLLWFFHHVLNEPGTQRRPNSSAFNEILQAEREAASDEEAIAGIRRERDKMRQRNSRLCRKYGLKGRRERG